jgi:hypothetical protein
LRTFSYLKTKKETPCPQPVGANGCRMLFILVPGGIEDVIRATSEPAATRTLPPHPEQEPSPEEIEAVKTIVKEHGYELLV